MAEKDNKQKSPFLDIFLMILQIMMGFFAIILLLGMFSSIFVDLNKTPAFALFTWRFILWIFS